MLNRAINWEPGNGTRYECLVSTVDDTEGEPGVLLVWLKRGGSGGPAMVVRPWSTVSLGYIMEKMLVNEADGAALLALLKQECGIPVYMPERYDDNGCRAKL